MRNRVAKVYYSIMDLQENKKRGRDRKMFIEKIILPAAERYMEVNQMLSVNGVMDTTTNGNLVVNGLLAAPLTLAFFAVL